MFVSLLGVCVSRGGPTRTAYSIYKQRNIYDAKEGPSLKDFLIEIIRCRNILVYFGYFFVNILLEEWLVIGIRGGGFFGTGVPGIYRFCYRSSLQGIVTGIKQNTFKSSVAV